MASEPGYSLLAVSDPSADMTATQTWAVLDAGQLGDGWTAPPSDPQAAAGTGAALAQGGAAAPWPAIPADAPGQGPTAWANGPAEGAREPLPGSIRQSPGGRRAGRDASDTEARGTAVPDAEATGRFTAGPETAGRYQADAETTGRFTAGPETAGRYQADAEVTGADGPGSPAGTRVSRAAALGRKPRKPPSRARVWLFPILMVLAVGTLVTVAYLHFVKGQASQPRVSAPLRTAAASSSPTPSLGPWKHITTRSEDSVPLTLTELFPAQFSSGGTSGSRTIDQAGRDCPAAVLGAGLQSAVGKAGCTQVMRASYLTTDQKIMGTIGVLNLVNDAAAQRAGQATGSAEFIDQLPAAHGPTHNLAKGTGLEEAVYKGHYLILIWAEFSNLHTPTTAAQRAELKTFSDNLVSGTANVSLTSRMVIGKPQIP
ncbi:MAG TPA: hypothetical protein VGA04_06130 [Streptosporangiaceae bacterium]